MRLRTRINILLQRAQLILLLAVAVPTLLMIALGIVLLAVGASSVALVAGVLMLAFCGSAIAGFVLASVLLSRSASLARVQNDFLSSVSHELRTPLTAMQVYVETLENDRVTEHEERLRCLRLIHQELRRLDSLVARLLELSRMQAGHHALSRQPVELDALIDEAVAAFRTVALGDDVHLEIERSPGLWTMGDRSALAQMLNNLLTNAWKYGPPSDKRIALRVLPLDGKRIEITVSDNGAGISPDERGRIFEYFVRGRTAVESNKPGQGLGLSIVQAIVRAHRGRIELRTGPEGGACFALQLPRARPEEAIG